MQQKKLIEIYGVWLSNQLHELSVRTNNYTDLGVYGEIQWNKSQTTVYRDDVYSTIAGLSAHYRSVNSRCAIINIEKKMSKTPYLMDYFFMQIHLLGHVIIEKIRPGLDNEDLGDISLMELAGLLFALVACRHYFNLDHLTPHMATELAWTLFDRVKVQRTTGKQFDTLDAVQLCSDILDDLQLSEIKLQH